MEGYKLFKQHRPRRGRGEVALYAREQLECVELCLGMDDEPTKSLGVRMKKRISMGDIWATQEVLEKHRWQLSWTSYS